MKYKKKVFSAINTSFKIAYCYVVEAQCNDHLSEHLRLGIFTSFEEALTFIAKNFYETVKSKISYSRETNNTWIIDNCEIKNQSIRHRVTDCCIENIAVDAREIRIRVDTNNFIILDNGKLVEISKPFFHDQVVYLNS